MIILHGTWIPNLKSEEVSNNGNFFLWGESTESFKKRARGRPPKVLSHPFQASKWELSKIIDVLGIPKRNNSEIGGEMTTKTFLIPAYEKDPQASSNLLCEGQIKEIYEPAHLKPWKITGLSISVDSIISVFVSFSNEDIKSAGAMLGEDIKFWTVFFKFVLELLSMQKFSPGTIEFNSNAGGYISHWKYVLDTAEYKDQMRTLVRAMPPICMAFLYDGKIPASRNDYLYDCLSNILNGTIKEWLLTIKLPGNNSTLSDFWLKCLISKNVVVQSYNPKYNTLSKEIFYWNSPKVKKETSGFKICFRLEEPRIDDEYNGQNWHLRYFLQDIKDPSLLVPAEKVWRESRENLQFLNKRYNQPQESLLSALGRASQIYTPIERSLHEPDPTEALLSTSEAYEFLIEGGILLKESGFIVLIPSWWKIDSKSTKKNSVGVKLSLKGKKTAKVGKGIINFNSIINYNWKIALGNEELTEEEYKKIVQLKEPLIRLRGKWVELKKADINRAISLFEDKASGTMKLSEALKLTVGIQNAEFGLPINGFKATGWVSDLLTQLSNDSRIKVITQPDNFNGILRPYQVKGVSWLYFMRSYGLGACLADDMGLGKTVQTLALLAKEKEDGIQKPSLLICPTSIIGNWNRESNKFVPSLKVMVHHGSNRDKDLAFLSNVKQQDLVITTYGLTYRDEEFLANVNWNYIILDEAQKIKNSYTKRFQAIRKFSGDLRLALTGTPIENRLSELWSILEFLNPGYLGSKTKFRKKFILPIERYNNKEVGSQLNSIIRPFILRRLKTDAKIIKDLPEKIEIKEYCNLTREQATLYEATVKDMLRKIEEKSGMSRRGAILSTITRLKQICNHPAQYLNNSSRIKGRSAKLNRVLELAEELLEEGQCALIFTQFKKMGIILKRVFEETFEQEILFLHGAISQKKRDEMVSDFSKENGPEIFILSLRAGGLGLNLTRASHVFHFDRWWNPAVEAQATDRAYRIGQTKNVMVHKFICEGTIEEKIDDMINSKKQLAKTIIGTGEGWLTELSTEKLRDLFEFTRGDILSD